VDDGDGVAEFDERCGKVAEEGPEFDGKSRWLAEENYPANCNRCDDDPMLSLQFNLPLCVVAA